MSATAKDRRLFERLEDIANIRYSVRGRDKSKNECLPRNIGGGGLGMCIPEELQTGTLLELEITIPDNPRKTIRVAGEVRWTRPFGSIDASQKILLHETGVKFLSVNQLAIGRVYTYSRKIHQI
jgi:hypothetical protein